MINTERVKQSFFDLIHINSPSRQERGVADYVKAKLAALGMEVEEDDAGKQIDGTAGNVIAFLKGNAEGATPIFFSCHMDTVEPTENLNIVIEGDVVKTDGKTILGGDDKAGIAAVLEGIGDVLERGVPHGDVQVLFSVSEEVGLKGARALDPSKIRGKLGYVLDTEKPVAGITMSAPTHDGITVEIFGTASHAGIAPEKGISAIIAASNAISKMKLGRIDDETSANIGKIEGGKARNIIPDYVFIGAEARSRNNEKLDKQIEHMKTLFEEEAAKMGARAEFKSNRQYMTYRFSEKDEVIQLAMKASRRIGIDPVFQEGGGGSDANIYNSIGIPAVVIGAGYMGAHSVTEQISIPDLVKASEYVAALIESAAEKEA